MKRFTLILSLLVAMVTTAMAAVGDAVNLENGTYVIRCNVEGEFAKYNGADRIVPIQQIDFEFCPEMNFTFNRGEGDNAAYYTIQTSDGKFVTYKGTDKYDQIEIKEGEDVSDDNKWWNVCVGNGEAVTIAPKASNDVGWNFSVSYNGDANGAMGFWDKTTSNGKSHWCLTRNDIASVPTGYVKIVCQGHVASYDAEKSSLVKADNNNSLFKITKNESNNTYTIQTLDGKYVTYNSTSRGGNVINISDEASATDDNKWWFFYPNIGPSGTIATKNVIDIFPKQTSISNTTASWNWAKDVTGVNTGIGTWDANDNNSYCQIERVAVTCKYEFTHEGKTVGTQVNNNVYLSDPYPELSLPYGVVATLEGTIEPTGIENGIVTVKVPVEYSLPFEPADSYDKISKWYRMTLREKTLNSYVAATNALEGEVDVTLRNLYAFVGNPFAGFKIYNAMVGSGKVLWSNWVNDNANPILFTDVESVTEGTDWLLSINGNGFAFKRNGTDYAYVNDRNGNFSYWVNSWAATDGGSRIVFTENTADLTELVENYKSEALSTLEVLASAGFDVNTAKGNINALEINVLSSPAKITEQLQSVLSGKYTLRNGDVNTSSVRYNKYLSAKPNAFNEAHGRHLSEDALWNFVFDGSVFYLYNEANDVYLGSPSSNGDIRSVPTAYYVFSSDKNENVGNALELHSKTETLHMNNHNSYGSRNNLFLSNYDENDAASAWHIEEPILSDELFDAIAEMETAYDAHVFYKTAETGTSLGQYQGNLSELKSGLVNAETIFNTPETERTYEEILAVKDVIVNAGMTMLINLPAQGKYYRIKGACNATPANYYITGNTNADDGRIACKAEADASTIFYYNDGKLLAYNSGLYIGVNGSNYKFSSVDGTTPATAIEFAGSPRKAGTYTVKSDDRFLYYKVYNGEVEIDRNLSNNSIYLDWTLEEVTELPVAISAAGYATLYAPVALEVADNVKAYTATINATTGNATLNEITSGVIPANTGVVIAGAEGKAAVEDTYNFAITTSAAFEGTNALAGTVAATYITADAYVLGIDNGEVGFYTAKKNQAENTAWKNNSHKAYLPKTAGMNAASYSFGFGEGTTGIEQITDNREQSTVIYDLTGRRIDAITVPGIYIVGGKKVLVK